MCLKWNNFNSLKVIYLASIINDRTFKIVEHFKLTTPCSITTSITLGLMKSSPATPVLLSKKVP